MLATVPPYYGHRPRYYLLQSVAVIAATFARRDEPVVGARWRFLAVPGLALVWIGNEAAVGTSEPGDAVATQGWVKNRHPAVLLYPQATMTAGTASPGFSLGRLTGSVITDCPSSTVAGRRQTDTCLVSFAPSHLCRLRRSQ